MRPWAGGPYGKFNQSVLDYLRLTPSIPCRPLQPFHQYLRGDDKRLTGEPQLLGGRLVEREASVDVALDGWVRYHPKARTPWARAGAGIPPPAAGFNIGACAERKRRANCDWFTS